jgi:predicted glycosyltransferase
MDTPSEGGILFYCQSAFGVGHLVRTARLIDALRVTLPTLKITLLYGGGSGAFVGLPSDVERIEMEALIYVGAGSALSAVDGSSPRSVFQRRRTLVLESFTRIRPRAVVFEFFPFGRWGFREEIMALLEACLTFSPRPRLWSSVREIALLSERTFALMADVVPYFDRIFVHSDPKIMPLDLGGPIPESVASRIEYTGYVTPRQEGDHRRDHRVLAHAGGGRDGRAFWTALQQFQAEIAPAELVRCGGETPDLLLDNESTLKLLASSWRSISMAGYNTVAEWLAYRVPTIFVPRVTDREQLTRVRALRERVGGPMVISDATDEALRRAWDSLRDDEPFRTDVWTRGQDYFAKAVASYF